MRKILLTTIILTICCNVIISSRPIDRIVISCIAPEPNDSVTVFSFDNKFNVKKAIKQSVSVDSVDFVKERIMGLEKNSDLDFSNLKVSYKIMLIRNDRIEATVFGAYSQPATAKLLICRKKTSFGVSKFSFLRGLRLILC